MSNTLKEKNEAKWKKEIRKIRQDFKDGKISREVFVKKWDEIDKKYPKIEAKHRTYDREIKEFRVAFKKKKEKILKKELRDV